ncbi:PefC/AfrB family outer membrane usher protein [Enterobacter roggenkampii]
MSYTRISVVSFTVIFFYSSFTYTAELNTAFLKGVSDVPSLLKEGVRYPSGTYYLDVKLNGERKGRMALNITKKEESEGQLCINPDWLKNANIHVNLNVYADTFDSVRGCYILGQKHSTNLVFDVSNQSLDFNIPQAWLLENNDEALWDYGVNGLRIRYDSNFNQNIQSDYGDQSLDAFSNFKTDVNLGRWVLSSDMNATRNQSENDFTTNNLTLSTAIAKVKGDLQVGYSQTKMDLFDDFGFYGVSLRSNDNMQPVQVRSYAPVITGVASGTSRITINQGGYTIYSRVVPPGPWKLEDIPSTGNGDLSVIVEDESGRKTVTQYPVATMSSLLRPGEYNYDFAIGERSNSNKLDDAFSNGNGSFVLSSFAWGFEANTINVAAILHNQYQALGLGVTQPLGYWGVVSLSFNGSTADYDDGSHRQGVSTSLKYAKSFTSKTDLQLLTYRYQSPGYTEFSSWDPKQNYGRKIYDPNNDGNSDQYIWFDGQEKARYEARLTQRLEKVNLNASFWQQTYWNRSNDSYGATLSANTTILNGISLFLSSNWSRNSWSSEDDYTASIGVSVPFTLWGVKHFSSSSIGYDRYNGTSFNNTVSGNVSDRLNYTVNAGLDEHSNNTAGATVSYAFDRVQTNVSLAQNSSATTISGNVSGSAIATSETGLLLTKEGAGTVAVLKIKDTPGITFNNSLPTNMNGDTVIYMSEYNPMTIKINPENVPDNVELVNTSYDVVPTGKAIIFKEFNYEHIQRYILRIKDGKGHPLNGGSAVTENGSDAGFVNRNGVLLMNLSTAPKDISIFRNGSKKCSFNARGLKAGLDSVQEIICE